MSDHPTPGKRSPQQPLTSRQLQTLRLIRDWWGAHHYAPTFAELAEGLGGIQKSGTIQKVEALERKGLVRRERGVHRSTMLTEAGRQYLEHEGDG